ncbi:2Fe-2S iron-sulfur cluster-binding protein [Streptomyces sp. NPDC101225]|uniref:2Fe-2S iron-sulfur cluster-binding protein n=1 Tax=Streptomyces sp. NPDC101225 TaxID=3366135 RepID=UPI003818103B
MSDDQHGEGTPRSGGRWDPLPQGDYDDGATAFVKLPEGGIDALLAAEGSPLAAPGHGYVPPPITPDPEPAAEAGPNAAGAWGAPADGARWPDPNAAPQEGADDRFSYNPAATQQWNFEEPAGPGAGSAPGHDVTGQWSIPVAGGDLPDESGEFTTSSLVQQWGGTPPATLPGGAAAPWATDGTGQQWAPPQSEEQAPHDEGSGQAHAPAEPPADAGHPYERPAAHPGGRPEERAPRPPGPAEPDPAAREADGVPAHTAGQSRARAAEDHARPHTGGPYADAPPDGPHAETPAEAARTAAQDPRGPGGAGEAPGTDEAAQRPVEAPEEAVERRAEPPADAVSAPAAPNAPESDGSSAGPRPAGAPDAEVEAPPPFPGEEHPLASYVLRVNDVERPVSDAWIGESLLYVLRERLGLAGAKDGCSQGECGACNVQVDGRLVASCLVPAVTAAGSEVRTVEGLAVDGQPSDVQRALARCGAVQCGFCVPGMAMTVHDLLEGNPAPTRLETRQALCGNLCRCSGYRGVVEAVQEVVAERETLSAGDSAEQDGEEARIPHQAGPGAGGVNASAFESPGAEAAPGPHDQPYGQDGGQA